MNLAHMEGRCWALVLLVSASACTGSVSDGGAPGPGDPMSDGPAAVPNFPGGSPIPSRTDPTAPLSAAVSTRFARLTHQQWENTVRDLLRLPAAPGLSSRFRVDSWRATFDNVGAHLTVDEVSFTNYQNAAEQLAAKVARDPVALARIAPPGPPTDPAARTRSFVEDFGRRAYRRALTTAEVDRHLALFGKGSALTGSTDAFAAGVELTLQAFLLSPHFLYRTELTSATGTPVRLSDDELATRLSYALTGSMPDDPLFAAARAGKLRSAPGLVAEADRLLTTPAGALMLADFHQQLLELRAYDQIDKSKELASFTDELRADLTREAVAFIDDVVIKKGLGVSELLTAPYSFVNRRVAELYGAPAASATIAEFRKVDWSPEQPRLGYLTQPGFLAAHSTGPEPDTIHRGVFIAKNLLCKPLPPPVDNIVIPELQGVLTNRERVEKITGKGTCGEACHGAFINPPGYALEHFDGLGRYRLLDNGKPVNAADSYVIDDQSRSFKNAAEFIRAAATSREAQRCYVSHWWEYLFGRELDAADTAAIDHLTTRATREKLGAPALVRAVVTSDSFASRVR